MTILKSIYNFLEQIGRAHAASNMARSGDYKGARQLMMEDFRGWV